MGDGNFSIFHIQPCPLQPTVGDADMLQNHVHVCRPFAGVYGFTLCEIIWSTLQGMYNISHFTVIDVLHLGMKLKCACCWPKLLLSKYLHTCSLRKPLVLLESYMLQAMSWLTKLASCPTWVSSSNCVCVLSSLLSKMSTGQCSCPCSSLSSVLNKTTAALSVLLIMKAVPVGPRACHTIPCMECVDHGPQ